MKDDESFIVVFDENGESRSESETRRVHIKHRPRQGEYIVVGDDTYRVNHIIHNYDEYGNTALCISVKTDQ